VHISFHVRKYRDVYFILLWELFTPTDQTAHLDQIIMTGGRKFIFIVLTIIVLVHDLDMSIEKSLSQEIYIQYHVGTLIMYEASHISSGFNGYIFICMW